MTCGMWWLVMLVRSPQLGVSGYCTNFSKHQNHLEGLLSHRLLAPPSGFLIQKIWDGGQELVCPFSVAGMLPVREHVLRTLTALAFSSIE